MECTVCHGPICVVGGDVTCEKCGAVQVDHPFTYKNTEGPKAPVIPPLEYPILPMEKHLALEKRVASLEKTVAELLEAHRKGRR